MNCAHIHELLPAWTYGDLPPETKAALDEHLASCPSCREEQAALTLVRRFLDAVPAPKAQVDVPRIYEEAGRRRQKQLRRWRWTALAFMGAAAALLVMVGLRLEVRWESHQLVVRWGSIPVVDSATAPGPSQVVAAPVVPAPRPDVTAADLQLVKDLIHALAANIEERDGKFEENLSLVELQLNQVQEQARTRWAATERFVSALHTSQIGSRIKGEK